MTKYLNSQSKIILRQIYRLTSLIYISNQKIEIYEETAEILTSKNGLFVRSSNSTNNFNWNNYSKSLFGKKYINKLRVFKASVAVIHANWNNWEYLFSYKGFYANYTYFIYIDVGKMRITSTFSIMNYFYSLFLF